MYLLAIIGTPIDHAHYRPCVSAYMYVHKLPGRDRLTYMHCSSSIKIHHGCKVSVVYVLCRVLVCKYSSLLSLSSHSHLCKYFPWLHIVCMILCIIVCMCADVCAYVRANVQDEGRKVTANTPGSDRKSTRLNSSHP